MLTLTDYLRVLRERWISILVVVLLALAAAGAIWFVVPQKYQTSATLYVSAQATETSGSAYQAAQLSQQRVTSYVELAKSLRIGDAVAKEIPSLTSEQVTRNITASSTLDSVIISITATDESPQEAAAVANAAAEAMVKLVDELERPTVPDEQAAVAVRVVQPAIVPPAPYTTGLRLLLAIGLVAGLILGIGLALLINTFDTSIKTVEQLLADTGLPNLGSIVFDPRGAARPLIVLDDPQSLRAEAFRQLRTNLQLANVDAPAGVIVVTSPNPRDGKTTTAVNLALALASAGHRTLLIDGDLRRPSVAGLLGLEQSVGLVSVVAGSAQLAHAIQHWTGGVDVLTSGPLPPNPSELLASRQMADLLAAMRSKYDMIVIDSPPLLAVTDAAAAAASVDGVLLVCRYKETSHEQAQAAVKALTAASAPLLGTIFNMVPDAGPVTGNAYRSAGVTSKSVPVSPVVHRRRRSQEPLPEPRNGVRREPDQLGRTQNGVHPSPTPQRR